MLINGYFAHVNSSARIAQEPIHVLASNLAGTVIVGVHFINPRR